MTYPQRIGPVGARVLQYIQRNPGLTATEILLKFNGMTRDGLFKALEHLIEAGVAKREKKANYVWYAVGFEEGPQRLPGRTKDIFTKYVPPAPVVTRPDAFAHELAPSRRGNEFRPHAPPIPMCVGKLNDTRAHIAVNLSPIKSNTFCKQSPPVAKPKVKKVRARNAKEGYNRIYDDAKVAEVLELHTKGMSYQEVATAAGVSKASVRRWCKGHPKNTPQPAADATTMPRKSKPTQAAFNAPRRNGHFTMPQGVAA